MWIRADFAVLGDVYQIALLLSLCVFTITPLPVSLSSFLPSFLPLPKRWPEVMGGGVGFMVEKEEKMDGWMDGWIDEYLRQTGR